ncbi:SurA N-terminal domain-containing protein [Ramlibacter sp. WS9]|uniref:SurA N-terminal domain-containing protein n=1 Tax=Ramlibacter sp. WS9 TaxID=1882741 RepID=UPI00114340FB|nr:SurA N-terminal domain-containing protein [Ramlibacter sp. WS9]ROZ66543.1 peptidyl-prolyl cis-trans isomerase [Ramlibacter sp. WS9]
MFEFVRKHTKIMQLILFLLIFPSFVLVGINGYNSMGEKGEAVAKIGSQDIKQGEWDAAHKQEVDRLRQQMPNLDAKLLDSPAARYATLERLVRDRVLAAAADKSKLSTSDQRLARELQSNEMIASLRGPDGKLDMARYRQLVGAQGMTPEMFEASVRADIAARQVLAGVGGTSFATPAQAAISLNAYFEKREVQVVRFASADYVARVNPSDADLEAFYKTNAAMFQAPEQASIEYLVLDLETVKKTVTVNEQDLKTYYDQNASRLGGQEERRASHILVAVPKGAPAAEREKAQAKATELLAAVKKAPDSFADVAKKNSQDPGSAANGGDLDFFARGAMTKAFEEAAFALKKGDISGLVETEFGFHIIKLADIKSPKQKTFEEMRPELEAELKKQQAQRKFAETAEAFTDTVYQQPDSLKPAADKLKLEIRTATNVRRTPQPGAPAALANPKFLNALFAQGTIEKKQNTEAVEVAPSTLVSGRIVQYTPARTLPFAEVKDRVRERVVAARAAEMAKKEGMEKLAAWKANAGAATLPAAITVSRQETQKQPGAVVEAALRADPAALPAFTGVELGGEGYAVVKVNKVLARETPADDVAKQDRAQYAQAWGSAENIAYYNLLKERLKVQILAPKPAAGLGEPAQTQ